MFGVDRFYLGYPAIGLLKFSTLGFFFLGQLIDILLIALQVVKPSDGSEYIMNYFGVGLIRIQTDNYTYIKPDESWNMSWLMFYVIYIENVVSVMFRHRLRSWYVWKNLNVFFIINELNWTYFIDINQKDWTQVHKLNYSPLLVTNIVYKSWIAIQKYLHSLCEISNSLL